MADGGSHFPVVWDHDMEKITENAIPQNTKKVLRS